MWCRTWLPPRRSKRPWLRGTALSDLRFDDIADLDQRLARDLRARLGDSPIECLEVDVIRIMPGPENPGHYRFIDCAAEIGAKHMLVVSHDPDLGRTADRFAALCTQAAERGLGIVLEFMVITGCRTLDDAVAVVQKAGQPNGQILIDTLHLVRAGHQPEVIAAYDAAVFPYIQLSDGPASIDLTNHEACLYDARQGRLAPGEGELPLREMLGFIDPALPISVEVRSRRYHEAYPDAHKRAQVVLERTKRFLRGADVRSADTPTV